MKTLITNSKLFIRKFFQKTYYPLIKFFIPKKFLLENYGLIAFGEQNRMRKNPLWVTVDWIGNPDILLNLNDKKLPFIFKDNSCKCIYSSHNLEHISYESAIAFFDQTNRILKENGELLLDIPCAKSLYKMIGFCINDPDNTTLKPFLNDFTTRIIEGTYNVCPENKYINPEWKVNPINKIIRNIASYKDGDLTHLPVFHDPEKIIRLYGKLKMDDFFEYLFNQLPEGKRYSGGHCEAWYPEKLVAILEKKGFDTIIRSHKESRILDSRMVPDRHFERDFWSFKISAIKKSSLNS